MNFLSNLPLAIKITITGVIISIISLTLIMAALIGYDKKNQKILIKNDTQLLASIISDRSTAAITFNDKLLAQENLNTLIYRDSIISACIYKHIEADNTHETTTLATFPRSDSFCPTSQPQKIKIVEQEEFINFLQPIVLDNTVIGHLYLKVSLENIQRRSLEIIKLFLPIIFISGIIAFIILRFIAKRLLQPLTALGETANLVAQIDDYSIRAKHFNHDEIGQVTDAFNHMLNVIEREHKELEESEEKFRLISASSKVGIFQLNTEGETIFANEELSAITSLPIDKIVEESWISVVHNDDRPTLENNIRSLIDTKKPIRINCRLSTSITKWINGQIDVLYSQNGQILGYLGAINDITDIHQAQTQLENMAFYDTLTGLANRRLFRNRLEHMINNLPRENNSLGLILLDIDHFKNVNDSLGHDAGDTLLTMIADRLKRCVRTSDTVARLGGDEFAIILPSINSSFQTSKVAEKILDEIQQPIILLENEYRISASIGLAMSPDDSSDAEELIKQADMALYRAKDTGRNNYQFFKSEMNLLLVTHLDLVRDLRVALENEEFHLVFQAQINLEKNKLSGFEALIRWTCPKRGFVPPDQFIHTAEDTGLIIPIGRFVIKSACQQLRELLDKKLINDDVVMTVNISAKQFQDTELVNYITAQLKHYNIPPNQFEIELTESVLMENIDEAIVRLEEIQQLGVLVSIDDFGTGYSSLGYLKRLPVNIIKVDRSFVYDIPNNKDDMEITAAVIAMAHNLNYKVVAEGVETPEQLEFLRNCNCDYGQGYLFSKPLANPQLIEYCEKQKQTVA